MIAFLRPSTIRMNMVKPRPGSMKNTVCLLPKMILNDKAEKTIKVRLLSLIPFSIKYTEAIRKLAQSINTSHPTGIVKY